jgi:sulfonate dioxygenase
LKISDDKKGPSYPVFLPTWDRSLHYDPYVLIENPPQRGLSADPKKPHLLPSGTKVTSLTPKFGTEVRGVQLSSLSDAGKNELSLLVAERGVVVFRDQDFVDLGPKALVEYGKYFGELHVHPVTGHPVGYPELHVVYRGPEQPYLPPDGRVSNC